MNKKAIVAWSALLILFVAVLYTLVYYALSAQAKKQQADPPPTKTMAVPGGGTIQIVEDYDHGNRCYVSQPSGAISCVWISGYGR